MRIHITGFVLWVIWCFIAAWIYNDYLLPAFKKPVPVVTVPAEQNAEADSLARLMASMPKDLLIFFEFNDVKFSPDPQTEKSVVDFRLWLEKYPQSTLLVTGHSDLVGTEDFNKELGMKRATAVGKYLETGGISTARMTISSEGELKPLGDYLTEEGRSKNRRTEVKIKMQ